MLKTLLVVVAFGLPIAAIGQVPVVDAASIREQLIQELHQLDQLAELNKLTMQQLVDYKLQLMNLKKLDPQLRGDVNSYIQSQLSGVGDYGVSDLNKLPKLNPSTGQFYNDADALLMRDLGQTPVKVDVLRNQVNQVGLNDESGFMKDGQVAKREYDQVLDDMRTVAQSRDNAEKRAKQASAITQKMAELDDNNTVGAIQLLAAQNALQYAQGEDINKAIATLIKNNQQDKAKNLIEEQKSRDKELKRLSAIKNQK